jgi:hypothetical protein
LTEADADTKQASASKRPGPVTESRKQKVSYVVSVCVSGMFIWADF